MIKLIRKFLGLCEHNFCFIKEVRHTSIKEDDFGGVRKETTQKMVYICTKCLKRKVVPL